MVGELLIPLQPAFFTVNADHETMASAGGSLSSPHHAVGSVVVAQQEGRIVAKLASRHDGVKIGAQPAQLQPRYVLSQVVGVSRDVAYYIRSSNRIGVHPP